MARKKPSVDTKCVADKHSLPFEKIIEVTFPSGLGCLISLRENLDQSRALIEIYRKDEGIMVWGGETK